MAMKKADYIETVDTRRQISTQACRGLVPPLPFSAPQFSECFYKVLIEEEFLSWGTVEGRLLRILGSVRMRSFTLALVKFVSYNAMHRLANLIFGVSHA